MCLLKILSGYFWYYSEYKTECVAAYSAQFTQLCQYMIKEMIEIIDPYKSDGLNKINPRTISFMNQAG